MSEEAFLRYRLTVVEQMRDSPTKRALIIAIRTRLEGLKVRVRTEAARRD